MSATTFALIGDTRRTRPAILPPVAKIRDRGRDPPGGRALERIHHQDHFHQAVVGRVKQRLKDKHVLAAHTGQQPHKNVVVGKADDFTRAERHAQALTDFLSQIRA